MAVDPPRQGDLLPLLRAHGLRERDLGGVGLGAEHAASRGQGADVDHQHLVLG